MGNAIWIYIIGCGVIFALAYILGGDSGVKHGYRQGYIDGAIHQKQTYERMAARERGKESK
jgi:hypothetical protein